MSPLKIKISSKNLGRQPCAEWFNFGVKGLRMRTSIACTIIMTWRFVIKRTEEVSLQMVTQETDSEHQYSVAMVSVSKDLQIFRLEKLSFVSEHCP
jgi:hypothetical protein